MNCLSNISLKSLKASKRKNLLVVLSIILSTCLITSIGILSLSIQDRTVQLAIEQTGGNYHGRYDNVNKRQINLIKNNEKVENFGCELPFGSLLKVNDKKVHAYAAISYMDSKSIEMSNMKLQMGRLPKKYNEVAIENWVLKRMKIKPHIGKKLSLEFREDENPDKHKLSTFVLSGIIKDEKYRKVQSFSTVLISKAFVLKNQKNSEAACYIRIKNGYDIKNNVLIIGDTVGLKRNQQFTNDTYISSTHWDLSMIVTAAILGLIVLIATVIVIYNIFYISIIEKINQFGLLRAVGSTKKQIRKIVFKEGLTLAGVGIPLGIILGHIISFGMGYILSMEELKIRFSIYVVLIAVVISLSTIIISLRKPQKLASKVSPMEAIRYGSMQINSNKKLRNSRKKVSIGNMAYLNLGRNKKRTIMTIILLSMSGVLFLTACTFLESMDIDNLAKTTINYEFALSGNTINKSTIRNIEKINGVKKIITKQCYYGIKVGKTDYALNAFGNDTLNTLKPYIKSGIISSDLLENQNGIIVTVNQDGKCKYNIGDKVTLNIIKYNYKLKKEYTIRKEVKVIAIMKDDVSDVVDSMNVQGDAFITSKAAYKKITNDSKISGVYIRINKNYFDKIKVKIKSISDNNMLYYRSQTDTKNQALRQLMGIKVALFGLIGIIALIGTLNLINTIITSIVARKKELGMLQAIGLSNTQMRKMLQMEGLYYSGISILLSITLGIPSGYMAYRLLVSAGADYAIYKLPIIPFLIMVVLIISIQLVITFLVGKSIKNESIIDRIRFDD